MAHERGASRERARRLQDRLRVLGIQALVDEAGAPALTMGATTTGPPPDSRLLEAVEACTCVLICVTAGYLRDASGAGARGATASKLVSTR